MSVRLPELEQNYLGWKKPEFIKLSINPARPSPPLNPYPKCHTYTSLKSLQGCQLYHFPGHSVQCLTSLLVKTFFLMSNLNLPWCNLRLFLLVMLLISWEKRLTPILLPGSCRVMRSTLFLLFPRLNTLSHSLNLCPPCPCPSLKAFRTSCWLMVSHHRNLHQRSWDRLYKRGRTGQNGSRKGTNFWSNCHGTSHPSFLTYLWVSAGNMHQPELVTCARSGKEWESRILHLYSSYLLFPLAEADSSFPWMVYFIGSYTIQIPLVALCLFMLEMKAQNSTAVLGRWLHSLLGCYAHNPCPHNLKLLPRTWWWNFTVLLCNVQLKGLSWASWSNVPKSFVMAPGISATLAVAVGQSRSGAAQPDLQSVKFHPKVASFAGQNTPKNSCAVPLPGLQRFSYGLRGLNRTLQLLVLWAFRKKQGVRKFMTPTATGCISLQG